MSKKRITIGILAHVDAGKTTLSEALLVAAGILPKAGRVDNGDSFLDTDTQEKRRGITIFSGEARLAAGNTEIILVDTPGHVDFSAEMERTLQILDYAVLVVSGRELVQGHTLTIWKLLQMHGIPVFLFINKMDLKGTNREKAMTAVKASLDEACVFFGGAAEAAGGAGGADATEAANRTGSADAEREADTEREADVAGPDPEELAMCDEHLLDAYLAGGPLEEEAVAQAIARRKIFPCWFGSALRGSGVDALLRGLDIYTRPAETEVAFSARVYRITRDKKGTRLTHMKITGGSISVREQIRTIPKEQDPAGDGLEKITQIRLLSGESFETTETAKAGQLAAVAGLEHTQAGQGLGRLLGSGRQAMLQPVLVYGMQLPEDSNVPLVLQQMRQLQEEDPQLHVRWNEQLREIQVRLMGEIQLEILQQIIRERFGFEAAFDEGQIEYRETLLGPVRGAGHFEPLRHYAEVHLLLEPLPEGSGLAFGSSCSTDVLDTNWQRLITTHLAEREYPGALMGAPITDLKITIEGGRAHLKHTEGGDFRQATCRAIRQALRKARRDGLAQLLEPWYAFRLELPREQAGRAMADIQRMGGSFETDELPGRAGAEDVLLLRGRAPVRQMRGYGAEVASYTRGYGHFTCSFDGFSPCQDAEEVIRASGYDPDRDLDNPADSVFCSHGAGRTVPWEEADEMMHVSIGTERSAGGGPEEYWEHGNDGGAPAGRKERSSASASDDSTGGGRDTTAEDKELDRIFQRNLSKNKKEKPKTRKPARIIEAAPRSVQKTKPAPVLPEYLLVDGYNIIFAWDELRELAGVSIDAAREALIDILANYQGYRQCEIIAVFDAYRVKGGKEHTEKHGGITVVFTGEAETADTYIERATYEMKKKYHVRVATSDRLEQMIILGNDAFRISAADFQAEVKETAGRIRDILEERRRQSEKENKNRINLPLHTE